MSAANLNEMDYILDDLAALADALYGLGRLEEEGHDLPPRAIIGMAHAFESLGKRAQAQLVLLRTGPQAISNESAAA